MLDDTSYQQALYLYLGAGAAFLLYMGWILNRYWSAAWSCFATLVVAALLLTPAYPSPTITTFAPALVVALFESVINGTEAARHAVKPLAFMVCLAILVSLLLRFILFRKPAKADE